MAVCRSDLYPENRMPIAGTLLGKAGDFDLAREALLINYGYNTARAYWGDLDHWRAWCLDHAQATDPLAPSKTDIENYLSAMELDGYSPNTVARRLTTLRAFFDVSGLVPNPPRERFRSSPASVQEPHHCSAARQRSDSRRKR